MLAMHLSPFEQAIVLDEMLELLLRLEEILHTIALLPPWLTRGSGNGHPDIIHPLLGAGDEGAFADTGGTGYDEQATWDSIGRRGRYHGRVSCP